MNKLSTHVLFSTTRDTAQIFFHMIFSSYRIGFFRVYFNPPVQINQALTSAKAYADDAQLGNRMRQLVARCLSPAAAGTSEHPLSSSARPSICFPDSRRPSICEGVVDPSSMMKGTFQGRSLDFVQEGGSDCDYLSASHGSTGSLNGDCGADFVMHGFDEESVVGSLPHFQLPPGIVRRTSFSLGSFPEGHDGEGDMTSGSEADRRSLAGGDWCPASPVGSIHSVADSGGSWSLDRASSSGASELQRQSSGGSFCGGGGGDAACGSTITLAEVTPRPFFMSDYVTGTPRTFLADSLGGNGSTMINQDAQLTGERRGGATLLSTDSLLGVGSDQAERGMSPRFGRGHDEDRQLARSSSEGGPLCPFSDGSVSGRFGIGDDTPLTRRGDLTQNGEHHLNLRSSRKSLNMGGDSPDYVEDHPPEKNHPSRSLQDEELLPPVSSKQPKLYVPPHLRQIRKDDEELPPTRKKYVPPHLRKRAGGEEGDVRESGRTMTGDSSTTQPYTTLGTTQASSSFSSDDVVSPGLAAQRRSGRLAPPTMELNGTRMDSTRFNINCQLVGGLVPWDSELRIRSEKENSELLATPIDGLMNSFFQRAGSRAFVDEVERQLSEVSDNAFSDSSKSSSDLERKDTIASGEIFSRSMSAPSVGIARAGPMGVTSATTAVGTSSGEEKTSSMGPLLEADQDKHSTSGRSGGSSSSRRVEGGGAGVPGGGSSVPTSSNTSTAERRSASSDEKKPGSRSPTPRGSRRRHSVCAELSGKRVSGLSHRAFHDTPFWGNGSNPFRGGEESNNSLWARVKRPDWTPLFEQTFAHFFQEAVMTHLYVCRQHAQRVGAFEVDYRRFRRNGQEHRSSPHGGSSSPSVDAGVTTSRSRSRSASSSAANDEHAVGPRGADVVEVPAPAGTTSGRAGCITVPIEHSWGKKGPEFCAATLRTVRCGTDVTTNYPSPSEIAPGRDSSVVGAEEDLLDHEQFPSTTTPRPRFPSVTAGKNSDEDTAP